MADLSCYVLLTVFNSISVTPGQWEGDNEIYAMEPQLK